MERAEILCGAQAHPTFVAYWVGRVRLRTSSLSEVDWAIFVSSGPVGGIDTAADVLMERGVRPIDGSLDVAMLNRIVVNIVNVSLKIILIAYQVFPKPPLPKGSFMSFLL